MNVIIREATINDTPQILDLIQQLAIYEKKSLADVKLTEEKILQHAFGEKPYFKVLVAEHEQKLVSYLLYFFTYAATAGAPVLYGEDLLVVEEYRKNGLGTRMMSAIVEIAKKNNCCRVEWHAFTWNTSAITFYESLGAKLRTDLVQVRLEVV